MNTKQTSSRFAPELSPLDTEHYRSLLRLKLHEQQEELADCHALLDELSFARDKEAVLLRGLTRRAELHALAAIDDIEQALTRLDNGTYSQCVRCDGRIGDSRLDALPTTRHCLNCAATVRSSR
jgi:RNA polymerase-binding transcription factor DksA